jgi:hypothetical protein
MNNLGEIVLLLITDQMIKYFDGGSAFCSSYPVIPGICSSLCGLYKTSQSHCFQNPFLEDFEL